MLKELYELVMGPYPETICSTLSLEKLEQINLGRPIEEVTAELRTELIGKLRTACEKDELVEINFTRCRGGIGASSLKLIFGGLQQEMNLQTHQIFGHVKFKSDVQTYITLTQKYIRETPLEAQWPLIPPPYM